ncbi:hypothetical protein CYMTET_30070 [Cymbomonas tetramitiformis]|uniref:C2 domain-containing protein n=1 Tax=Cymbomonas tetramitiformis TaxID=36881 RepID=A0AAE0KUJ4_9CHLO|nr:hypothetical protein CYMTET_30070 [Cymbomonas tetramitiformis]
MKGGHEIQEEVFENELCSRILGWKSAEGILHPWTNKVGSIGRPSRRELEEALGWSQENEEFTWTSEWQVDLSYPNLCVDAAQEGRRSDISVDGWIYGLDFENLILTPSVYIDLKEAEHSRALRRRRWTRSRKKASSSENIFSPWPTGQAAKPQTTFTPSFPGSGTKSPRGRPSILEWSRLLGSGGAGATWGSLVFGLGMCYFSSALASGSLLWLVLCLLAGAILRPLFQRPVLLDEAAWAEPAANPADEPPPLEPRTSMEREGDTAVLVVQVCAARNLPGVDFNGTSDPYVVLNFRDETRVTQVVRQSCKPVFGRAFSFRVSMAEALRSGPTLEARIYGKKSAWSDVQIGEVAGFSCPLGTFLAGTVDLLKSSVD